MKDVTNDYKITSRTNHVKTWKADRRESLYVGNQAEVNNNNNNNNNKIEVNTYKFTPFNSKVNFLI